MTKARTEKGDYVFKVSDRPDHSFWISMEPGHDGLPALKDALLGFDLPAGTTHQEARAVAGFMNENLAAAILIIFDTHPLFSRAPSA